MRFRIGVALESYQKRGEDRAQVLEMPEGLVLIVADGVGGQPGGGEAADLTVDLLTDASRTLPDKAWNQAQWWADLLDKIDGTLVANPVSGMTTCVVIALAQEILR